jgi:hypothetical protein
MSRPTASILSTPATAGARTSQRHSPEDPVVQTTTQGIGRSRCVALPVPPPPETTTLHRIVREHLETYLALARVSDPMGEGVPDHAEKEFRSYLKCGILAHGFARARCSSCGYDFIVGFSCRGRG